MAWKKRDIALGAASLGLAAWTFVNGLLDKQEQNEEVVEEAKKTAERTSTELFQAFVENLPLLEQKDSIEEE